MRKRPARTAYFMRTGSYVTIPPGRMRWPVRTRAGQPRPTTVRRSEPSYVRDDERTRRRTLYGF